MTRYLSMKDARAMTYAELERWWDVDFDVLVTSVIAEATGAVHESVTAALHSDDWLEQWADALYCAVGELVSSVERMTYTRDARLDEARRRAGVVELRMGQVNALVGAQRREEHRKASSKSTDARQSVLAILSRHHREEFGVLRSEEVSRRGLPPNHPFYDAHYDDGLEAIEDAVRRGLVQAPLTPDVHALLNASLSTMTATTAKDVTQQRDRVDALRHPLLLRPWGQALEHLLDRHCALAGIDPAFTITLPLLDFRELRVLQEADAWQIINRRRFIRALAQRRREHQMHQRQLTLTVTSRTLDVRRPWDEAASEAREALAHRHSPEVQALLTAYAPFCEPGTTVVRADTLTGRVRHDLHRDLRQALTDGRWRALLEAPGGTT